MIALKKVIVGPYHIDIVAIKIYPIFIKMEHSYAGFMSIYSYSIFLRFLASLIDFFYTHSVLFLWMSRIQWQKEDESLALNWRKISH